MPGVSEEVEKLCAIGKSVSFAGPVESFCVGSLRNSTCARIGEDNEVNGANYRAGFST
jgi:hypothetical protein